ncbi:MAG TPA: DinB family protein [Vicinamibacterales bacterium]|nr:DinB family protein [Vicinamibacterales bacterium]
MNVRDLQTMIDYHYWARNRLFEALEALTPGQYNQDLGSSFKSIRDTATHTYAAEWAWYQRWQGESPSALLPSDQFADLAALKAAWLDHERKMRAFVDGLTDADVDRVIEFRMLNGTTGASPIGQMVQHVVNHASYHRGQITTLLRQLGAAPAKSMDMIAYFRVVQAGVRS